MSKLLEQIKKRRSIRKYKQVTIPREVIDKIIEVGLYAANGMGYQNKIILWGHLQC